jgi:hypothetical protein
VLASLGALGIRGDPERAAHRYRRAIALSDPAARPLLRQLGPGGTAARN